MKQVSESITAFFEELTIDANMGDVHHYNDYLHQVVKRFQQLETKERAYDVYRVFLECYGYRGENDSFNFLSFSEKMRGYEENASVLTHKQRDHFIHSVNVFLLGLAIYETNDTYRSVFEASVFQTEPYAARKSTPREEFFFRWGLAALCHDIGYPIEIITNQINDFINFTSCPGCDSPHINARVEFDRFDLVNAIPESVPKREFIHKYYDTYETCVYIDLLKPVDLLAHKMHLSLGVNLGRVKERLDGYIADSGRTGRVDHGFFSAIILLKWFGFLIQKEGRDPDEFYLPIVDVATAILLHNFYSIALVKNTGRPNEFSLGQLEVRRSPLSYLLMLCDELQEWNRELYGESDKLRVGIQSAQAMLSDRKLEVNYILTKGAMPEEFVGAKTGLLNTLLNLDELFPDGLHVSCEAIADYPSLPESYQLSIEHLEKIAIAIHNRYNETTKRLYPGKQVDYPNYADLPKEKKYYNYQSAMDYPIMLNAVECEIRPISVGDPGLLVTDFLRDEVEILARREHDRWMQGRVDQGYRYGRESNKSEKLNQHMIPYEDLPDEIKEFDRDPARNIPQLLSALGLGVYRKRYDQRKSFTQDEIEIMARRIHAHYNELSRKQGPDKQIEEFDALSEELKASNRRQARGIPNKLAHIGCSLHPAGMKDLGEPVTSFSLQDIEMLSRIEHHEWMGDKIRHGWTFGPTRDIEKRKNPFLVDYESLKELHKELDRDTIRKMPDVVAACGYAIFRD